MKKNKNVILLGVLGLLVVVYLLVTFTSDKSRSKSFRTELVSIDTAKVTQVTMTTTSENTVINKTGPDSWLVEVDGGTKPARASVVTNLLTSLEGVKPSRLVARTADKWKDYTVDSTGTRVKIFEGNQLTLDLIIGRFGVEGQRNFHTYVRLAEENDVYLAKDFMGISIAKSADDFRNGDILRIRKDSLTQVSFNYPDSAFSVVNTGGSWISDQFEVDSTRFAQYLGGLSFVTSKNFTAGEGLRTPELNVTFSFSNQPEIQVSAHGAGNGWVLQSSDNTDEYFNDQTAFDKIFKGISALQ